MSYRFYVNYIAKSIHFESVLRVSYFELFPWKYSVKRAEL